MKALKSWPVQVRRIVLLSALAALTGCANMYVDTNTKDVDAAQFKKPVLLHSTQVLFEFQTKGVLNARATAGLKARVIDQIKSSGLFSEVSDTPVSSGALISIALNNVPLSDDAFSKGFVTGLTFGLAGNQVSDGYVCIARYTSGIDTQPIVKQARHAIHTTVGVSSAPANGIKAENLASAVTIMVRQIVSNVMNDLSHDAAFK